MDEAPGDRAGCFREPASRTSSASACTFVSRPLCRYERIILRRLCTEAAWQNWAMLWRMAADLHERGSAPCSVALLSPLATGTRSFAALRMTTITALRRQPTFRPPTFFVGENGLR